MLGSTIYHIIRISTTLLRESWALYPRRVIAIALALVAVFSVIAYVKDMPKAEPVPVIGDACIGIMPSGARPGSPHWHYYEGHVTADGKHYNGHLGVSLSGSNACLLDDSWRADAGKPMPTPVNEVCYPAQEYTDQFGRLATTAAYCRPVTP